MMKEKEHFIDGLTKCITEDDLREYFKNLKFIHGESFDTNIMYYKNSKIEVVTRKINVSGLYEVVLKILWYFKSNKMLGFSIQNSGEKAFFHR